MAGRRILLRERDEDDSQQNLIRDASGGAARLRSFAVRRRKVTWFVLRFYSAFTLRFFLQDLECTLQRIPH